MIMTTRLDVFIAIYVFNNLEYIPVWQSMILHYDATCLDILICVLFHDIALVTYNTRVMIFDMRDSGIVINYTWLFILKFAKRFNMVKNLSKSLKTTIHMSFLLVRYTEC